MPLPLPSLDTRRWADLVSEGQALIPRYAPSWTDHNAHDPGITLVELFAWLTEQLLYRTNRVPERHLRKFLALMGYPPLPPRPATIVLGATLGTAQPPVDVPGGLTLTADASSDAPTFVRVRDDVRVHPVSLVAVQSFDGARFRSLTAAWRDGAPFQPLGVDPRVASPGDVDGAPALYLGFDAPVPPGETLSLFVAAPDDGMRLRERLRARAASCDSAVRASPCRTPGGTVVTPPNPPLHQDDALRLHHSVRVVWEYHAAGGWVTAGAGGPVPDETRGLTLGGMVRLDVTQPMALVVCGMEPTPRYYVRCRLTAGRYDATPVVTALVPNAIRTEQRAPLVRTFVVEPGAAVTGTVTTGLQPITMAMGERERIQAVTVHNASAAAPPVRVLEWVAPTALLDGRITIEAAYLGVGLGFPGQSVVLDGAPFAADSLRVLSWTTAGSGQAQAWSVLDDLDAAGPAAPVVAVRHDTGELAFGDGINGRMPASGAMLLAVAESTAGALGNLPAGRHWTVSDSLLNQGIAGGGLASLQGLTIDNVVAGFAGADAETVGDAMERAAAFLWSHERLRELADAERTESLDQIPVVRVLACDAPERATTVLDYERIARETPGTAIARARAFADFDYRVPCYDAPGTISVVVVPHLAVRRPQPSDGLLRAVRQHLESRRLLTTRVLVVGPEYVELQVTACVRACAGTNLSRLRTDIAAALDAWLHPLTGGPAGLGWPFGRDVYRSEMLAVIDAVEGVDHVWSASLLSVRNGVQLPATCSNVCVPDYALVAPLPHRIDVVPA